jgi:hypothetical protein
MAIKSASGIVTMRGNSRYSNTCRPDVCSLELRSPRCRLVMAPPLTPVPDRSNAATKLSDLNSDPPKLVALYGDTLTPLTAMVG